MLGQAWSEQELGADLARIRPDLKVTHYLGVGGIDNGRKAGDSIRSIAFLARW